MSHPTWVRGLKFNWLESERVKTTRLSHPTWVRGLKFNYSFITPQAQGRTPHGCVDWNIDSSIESLVNSRRTPHGCVDWNFVVNTIFYQNKCRTPHGCVDWNRSSKCAVLGVFPSHPTWVRGLKLSNWIMSIFSLPSHPTWVRGLKYVNQSCSQVKRLVAPHMGAWIEI